MGFVEPETGKILKLRLKDVIKRIVGGRLLILRKILAEKDKY